MIHKNETVEFPDDAIAFTVNERVLEQTGVTADSAKATAVKERRQSPK